MPGETAVIDKLVLDFDPDTKEELLSVHPDLVSKMKPHQVCDFYFYIFVKKDY